jgi:DNA-binding NarL/FixJ family response regulator
MDIQMPNMDGWEATEILVRKYKNLKIIGLSSYDNEAFIDRFIKSGGRGYLLKAQEFDEIVSAIEQVAEIGFYLTERVPLQKIQDYVNNKVLSPNFNTTNLSDQEIKIVQLICQEKTSLEIADLLCVSKKTIESHRDKILNKINARNMVGIAIYAMKHKLIGFKD